jgi:hypothetical protein
MGYLSKADAAEVTANLLLADAGCQKYILPPKLVLGDVCKSEKGLRRLELAYPYMCKQYPEWAGVTPNLTGVESLPHYVQGFDWLGLRPEHFCDYVLGLDVIVERDDGVVIGVDVTTQSSESRACLDKTEKLQGLKPILKTLSIDTVVVLSLEMGDIGYRLLDANAKAKLVKQTERRVEGLNPRKWVRTWEFTIS